MAKQVKMGLSPKALRILKFLRWVGILGLCAGMAAGVWGGIIRGEKPGVAYLFGHPADVLWSIAFPFLTVGVAFVASPVLVLWGPRGDAEKKGFGPQMDAR
jgi:hypothetical protein